MNSPRKSPIPLSTEDNLRKYQRKISQGNNKNTLVSLRIVLIVGFIAALIWIYWNHEASSVTNDFILNPNETANTNVSDTEKTVQTGFGGVGQDI